MRQSLLLLEAIKSKQTIYKKGGLDQFLSFTGTTDYDRLTKISPDQIQTMLEDLWIAKNDYMPKFRSKQVSWE
ncbi:MAG: hypothetical protein HW420_1548 [Candidatus Nitrosotenuis sp.]|nr:hypothetical protein [Candidatus Nitrosotenuis sp.]